MAENDNLLYEFVKPLGICYYIASRFHVHLNGKRTSVVALLIFIACLTVYLASLVASAIKFFYKKIKFDEAVDGFPVIAIALQSTLKTAILVAKKREIKDIIVNMRSLWRLDNLTDMQIKKKDAALKQLNLCQVVFYWINVLLAWLYMVLPFFELLLRRYVLHQQSEFRLPISSTLPFDPLSSWTRYIAAYAHQIFCMMNYLTFMYLGADYFLIALCALLSIEFNLLQEDFRNLKPTASNNNHNQHFEITVSESNLRRLIKIHQSLILVSKKLDKIFNEMIFINMFIATIIICFFGVVATAYSRHSADEAKNFVVVVATMLPILIVCYYGEMLTQASSGIADAVYESLWYTADTKHKKALLLVIMRCQQPAKLTALKYAPISLRTFTKVLSSTWSLFSLMTSYADN